MPKELFTPQEAAAYLRLSVETLAQWRWRRIGPAFIRKTHPGGKKPIIRYTRGALDTWLFSEQKVA